MEEFDVVVIGTGAAGLTAAVVAAESGATVGVFEKADLVGGTAAWSGGQVWIPNNPHMPEVGIADDREQAITYIMSLSRGLLDQELVEAYVDAGPEMVALLEARTPVQFYAVRGYARLPPRVPWREPRRRAHDRVPALSVRRARRVGTPSHTVAVLRHPEHHDERDAARQGDPRSPAGGRNATAPGAQRARLRTSTGRPPASRLPRPRRRAAHRLAGPRADHRGRRCRRRRLRHARRRRRSARPAGRDPRLRRLRVGPRAVPRVPPRSDVRTRCRSRPTPATGCGWR